MQEVKPVWRRGAITNNVPGGGWRQNTELHLIVITAVPAPCLSLSVPLSIPSPTYRHHVARSYDDHVCHCLLLKLAK